ncbi:MAG: CocE/NonD family hydrolase [Promethearchaeota archaeon]
MGKYKYIKATILVIGLVGIFGGTLISALMIRLDVEAMDFVIDEETVRKYGYFNDISETELTGTILKPIDNRDPNEKRPCVFVWHGMFLNRYMQMQTAMYFAKAGMYVVMFDDPGQGESMSCYRLGYELEAIGKTAIDYFIEEGFEKYDMNVDLNALGVNGHSYGGITSTLAGINRPNRIKAVAAIWAWSELPQTVSDITIGLDSDFEEDFLGTPIYTFLTGLTNFGDALYYDRKGEYSEDHEDILDTLEDRNTIDRVEYKTATPPNYLLIAAYHEELITADQLIDLMAMASWNSSGAVSYKDLNNDIGENIEKKEEWNNLDYVDPDYKGDFSAKTARKLYLPKETEPMGHAMEGFTVEAYVRILEWYGDAFDWDVKEVVDELEETGIETDNIEGVDGTLPMEAIWKWGGWLIALMALVIAFPAIVSYLIRLIKFKNSEKDYQYFMKKFLDPKEDRFGGFENKLIGGMLGIYLVAELLSIIIPLSLGITPKMIGIPFIITDALILIMLGRVFIVIPALIIFLLLFFKNTNISLKTLGVPDNKRDIFKDIIIGLSISLVFIIVFNLIGIISLSPRLIPRRSPSLGYLGILILAIYLFIFFFFDEMIFRGSIQTKIHNFVYSKFTRIPPWFLKWIEFWFACITQAIILMVGTFIGLMIALGGIPPVLVSGFLFMGLAVTFIPAFLSTYIYQRTRSIIPCIIASALIMTFILGGSFIGAVTF